MTTLSPDPSNTSPQIENRVNVLFVHRASESFGGGSKMLWRLLGGLDSDLFDVTVLSQFEDELCRRLSNESVPVETVPYRGSLDTYDKGIFSQPFHRKLETVFRTLQFTAESLPHLREADVIWCDCLRSVLTIGSYASLSPTPVIWNIGLGYESTGFRKLLNTVGLTLADYVFIESTEQARSIFTTRQYDRHAESFVVFHKGIDTDYFSPIGSNTDDGPLRVGTASSITPRKGLEPFLEAAATILEERSDVEFTIAGDTVQESDEQYFEHLRERVADDGIESNVEFLGWVDDMPSYYNSLDVFVLPSFNEGIPGAVREAMAMEVPTIATAVGGTPDVVRDGETGLLIEPKNTHHLAVAIRYLLDHPEERRRLGSTGRRLIEERFSIEGYVKRYQRLLLELGGGVPNGSA